MGKVKLKVRSMQHEIVKTFNNVDIDISNEKLLSMVGAKFSTSNTKMMQLRMRGKYFITIQKPRETLEKYIDKHGSSKDKETGQKVVKAIFVKLAMGGEK